MGFDGPKQDGDGVRLVVISGTEATRTNGIDHRLLIGIALACDETLDRADRDALIGDRVLLTPCGERGEEPAMNVRSVSAEMSADFFVVDDADASSIPGHALEPGAETQIAHAAAVVAAGAK